MIKSTLSTYHCKNDRILTLLTLTLLLFFSSCSKNEQLQPEGSAIVKLEETSNFFISKKDVVKLLSVDIVSRIDQNARTAALPKKAVENISDFVDQDGQVICYIINYKDSLGYTVLSADRRLKPILAFSEKGNLSSKTDNPGLLLWFDFVRENFKGVQKDKIANIDVVNYWKQLESGPDGKRINPAPEWTPELSCEWFVTNPIPTNLTIEHLTDTYSFWRQGTGYNYYCPAGQSALNCNFECNKAVTGCGPVAVGQVLRYHKKPVTINGHSYTTSMFDAMPRTLSLSNCNPTNQSHLDVARLLRDAGEKLGVVYNTPIPGPIPGTLISGSGCQSWNLPGHTDNFFSDLGFTSYDCDFFNCNDVVPELRARRPVVVFGSNCNICLNNQHIWVMDGIKELYAIFNDLNGFCYENRAMYFQMNWGWQNNAENAGWFTYTGITGSGTLYNSANMKAYIVRP